MSAPVPPTAPPETSPTAPAPRPSPWLEIGVTILVPALILMKGTAYLGPLGALALALAFPLGWGLHGAWQRKGFGLLPAIGVVSTLATGGIGVLQLDAQWLAIKEAAVPAVLGLAVAGSAFTSKPLIHALVLHPGFFEVQRVRAALAARRTTDEFERRLRQATFWLAGTFAFSSAMNYMLARWIVHSPAGSEAFNEELGRLTLLSYPMIALPSMVMMMVLLAWLARVVRGLTGLAMEDMLVGARPVEPPANPQP